MEYHKNKKTGNEKKLKIFVFVSYCKSKVLSESSTPRLRAMLRVNGPGALVVRSAMET